MVDRLTAKKIRKQNKDRYKKAKAKAIKNLQQYKNADGTQKENSIERRVRVLLDSMGLYYIQEKIFIYKGRAKKFDFYVTDGINYTFCIECDGDYYHASAYQEGDQKYSDLTKIQRKNLRNDKFKNNMLKELGIPLLRFKEKDIKNNIDLVKEQIEKQVKHI
jgi:very-short-patch-repair endonuclease